MRYLSRQPSRDGIRALRPYCLLRKVRRPAGAPRKGQGLPPLPHLQEGVHKSSAPLFRVSKPFPLLNWPQKAQKGPWDPLPRESPRNPKKCGAGGLQPPWSRLPAWARPATRPRGPGSSRPPSRPQPRGRWHRSPPARPAPAAGPLSAAPPGPLHPGEAGARGARSAGARAGGGFESRPGCPYARVYPHTPIYARMGVYAWVCGRVHMHTYATHGLPERPRRLFLLRRGVPSHPQHNRCRRPRRRAMRLFLAPRIRHIYMEK